MANAVAPGSIAKQHPGVSLNMRLHSEGRVVYEYLSDAAAQEAMLRGIARHNPSLYAAVLAAVLSERPEQLSTVGSSPLLPASPKGTVVH